MLEDDVKQPSTAQELLKSMENHMKNYAFEIFSSAETVTSLGIDFLVRLGVKMVWIGVESKKWAHSKVKNVDFKKLFAELQRKGIIVNSSAILFLEHHDKKTLQEDIDWVIGLDADLTQFMNYTPLPQTTLYKRLKETSKLKSLEDVPYQKYTGAAELNWLHPHINDPKKHFKYLKDAFRKKYLYNGSGLLNMTITALLGLQTAREDFKYREENGLNWNPETLQYEKTDTPHYDAYFKYRIRKIERVAMLSRPTLLTLYLLSPNKKIRRKTKYAIKLARELLGKKTVTDRLKSWVLLFSAIIEGIKYLFMKIRGHETIIYQPQMRKIEYNMESSTVIAIGKKLINEWVKLKKPYHWVQNQLRLIPSKEDLLKKIQQISKPNHLRLSLPKMQEYWAQIFTRPENVKNYWEIAGGTF